MFVVIQHQISDPKTFSDAAKKTLSNLPAGVKCHQALPNAEGSNAVCLWEADSIDIVKNIVEPAVGSMSKNLYFQVESQNAMGLPV